MTNKDLEFFKINLDSYGIHIDTISVLTSGGEYKIKRRNDKDMYMVEYIPIIGAKEFSVHFTRSEVIEYIKEGEVYRE